MKRSESLRLKGVRMDGLRVVHTDRLCFASLFTFDQRPDGLASLQESVWMSFVFYLVKKQYK